MKKLGITTAITALLFSSTAFAQSFNFTDQAQRNTVAFELDAPFETINAVANGVEGQATLEGNKVSGRFRVKVTSIRTGNESRDEHLTQEKWLNAKKWPYILFTFKDLELPANFKSGKAAEVKAKGSFSVHGVERSVTVSVKVQYFKASELTAKRLPGNLIRIKSKFEIKLPDYGVAQSDSGVKSLIGLKVGETAAVSIDFFGTDAKK